MSDEPKQISFDFDMKGGAPSPAPFVGEQKSMATLIPFPLRHRHRKIVMAAETLRGRKTQKGREAFWGRTISCLADELGRHGCDEDAIASQLRAFHAAVEQELNGGGHDTSPARHDERGPAA